MPTLEDWIHRYSSASHDIKLRAAQGILQRGEEAPLELLVEILETLSWEGLGRDAEKALLRRRDQAVVPKMIALLDSKDHFVREVACRVLGHFGDKSATRHLLRMIDDPNMMVRRAAGFSIAFLKDSSALGPLQEVYERHRDDDSNVLLALQCAIQSLTEDIGD